MKFPSKTVYPAGPITGLSYDEARLGWRPRFANMMPSHIHLLSPMRGKDFAKDMTNLSGDPIMYPDNPIATAAGILMRDFNDVKNCDLVVANFLGARRVSIGTCVEFGFAHALQKPVVLIIEKEGLMETVEEARAANLAAKNPHWHAFITEIAKYHTSTVEEAAGLAIHLLTPGV